jgi:hypothetical protein
MALDANPLLYSPTNCTFAVVCPIATLLNGLLAALSTCGSALTEAFTAAASASRTSMTDENEPVVSREEEEEEERCVLVSRVAIRLSWLTQQNCGNLNSVVATLLTSHAHAPGAHHGAST